MLLGEIPWLVVAIDDACVYSLCSYFPQGRYNITPEGYAHMTHQLCGLAEGHVVVVLEVSNNQDCVVYHLSLAFLSCTQHTHTRMHAQTHTGWL